jgi:hypothetical protein
MIDDIKVSGTKSKRVVLQYQYAFNDQDFTGQRYNFGDRLNYFRNKEHINKNLLGIAMPCYVDPNNPSHSVLHKNFEPNVTRDVFYYGCATFLLMLACVICSLKSKAGTVT